MTSILQFFGFARPAAEITEDEDGLRIRKPHLHEESYHPDQFFTAFRQGNYQQALRTVDSLKNRGKMTPDFCYYIGATLVQLGRHGEAEKFLREYLEIETDSVQIARGYATLAQMFIQQERFDDAMTLLSSGLEHCRDKAPLHRALAEVALRRGDDPTSALQLARLATHGEMPEKEEDEREVTDEQINMGGNLATLAWILAAAEGDEQEVDQLAQQAASLVRGERVAASGQVYYHAGLAYATLGDRGRSMRCFEEALLLDPKGMWGRCARMMAHGMSKG